MSPAIACVAPALRQARGLARALAERLGEDGVGAFSLASFLAADDAPARIVLCPAGRSVSADRAFLAAAARRLLWPLPPARLREAVGGLRNEEIADGGRPAPAGAAGPSTALLLEGEVRSPRARAALAAGGARTWIVESPGRVRLSNRELEHLARRGVRWTVLAPVLVVAVYASPGLARAARSWGRLFRPRPEVWVRPPRRASRRRTGRRS